MEGEGRMAKGPREVTPKVSDALSMGRFVSVSARIGNDLMGYVCDWNEMGLLLDVRDPNGDTTGLEFLPWSSIERVSIGE